MTIHNDTVFANKIFIARKMYKELKSCWVASV